MSLIEVVEGNTRGRFASVVYRSKRGEIARYTMILGPKYYGPGGVLARSLVVVEGLTDSELVEISKGIDLATMREARTAVIESLSARIAKGKPAESHPLDAYTGADGETVAGARVHRDTGKVYLAGMVVRKAVMQAGEPHKPVNSAPLTLAKRAINRGTPAASWRTFMVDTTAKIAANGREWATLEVAPAEDGATV